MTTNPANTVLYVGVTNDLQIRLRQYYQNRGKKQTFAGRYYCYKLVYYEFYENIDDAIEREKALKDMNREKKEALIENTNPGWHRVLI